MSRRFAKLGRDAVKRLAAGERLSEGGVTAERMMNGTVRWSVNIMVSGRRVHRVIGRDTEGTGRAECESFIERAKTEERDGRLNLPNGRKTWLSFEQIARRYLDRMKAGGGKNLIAKTRQLEKHLISYFGAQRADTLSDFTVNTYKSKRVKAGAAAGTVNRELATLKHMLRDAVRARDLKAVPCQVKLLHEPMGRTTVLSAEQSDALLKAAVADQNADLWLFVAFGLNTAMRHREILRARWDEIDWDRRRLHIGKAKAGGREQPLTTVLVAMLTEERKRRYDKAGPIFPPRERKGGTNPHANRMSKPFARAVTRAKLDAKLVTPHVMRHTAITRLVQAGVDLPTIQRISGHKTIAMVLRYAHVSGSHVDAAMQTLDRTLPEPACADRNAVSTQVSHELHTGPEKARSA